MNQDAYYGFARSSRERGKKVENFLKEIMMKNFPNFDIKMNILIHGSQRTQNILNIKISQDTL